MTTEEEIEKSAQNVMNKSQAYQDLMKMIDMVAENSDQSDMDNIVSVEKVATDMLKILLKSLGEAPLLYLEFFNSIFQHNLLTMKEFWNTEQIYDFTLTKSLLDLKNMHLGLSEIINHE